MLVEVPCNLHHLRYAPLKNLLLGGRRPRCSADRAVRLTRENVSDVYAKSGCRNQVSTTRELPTFFEIDLCLLRDAALLRHASNSLSQSLSFLNQPFTDFFHGDPLARST